MRSVQYHHKLIAVLRFCFGIGLPAFSVAQALAAELQVFNSHVPSAVKALRPINRLASTNRLNLAIGLPLRQTELLTNMLQDIYNPASTNFHHFITPEQFTALFGPTDQGIQAVTEFARTNGFRVTEIHSNHMLVDVDASVADIERAFHVRMLRYQHPTENRAFYAPDDDPSLSLSVPLLGISGLNNYNLPKPRYHVQPSNPTTAAAPNAGAGPNGGYMGSDFRKAYAPDTTMTGAGQAVGLLQFDGYTASDISYYESKAGLPNVPLVNVLLDGFTGTPTGGGGQVEVSLDIEMAISMAPGLSEVIVYEAGPAGNWHDILNRMANDNLAKQLSCSWYIPGGGPDPVADQIFQQMALQGQSFYNASGDYDAYVGSISFPGDTPYITQVGGTTLSTAGPGSAYVSETVWNWGNGIGSGGGVSTSYSIPSYQTNIDMTANKGSTTKRNTPDVALTADNVYVRAQGSDHTVGGTSCAAPLWAGFGALINQAAASAGRPPVGFINPAVNAITKSAIYNQCFHDITTGNNTNSGSPNKFYAVTGYDLCTGWGTPAGQQLITALGNPEPLFITPTTGFASLGGVGGPFTVTAQSLVLTNTGGSNLNWTLANTSSWLNVSPASGTLTPGGAAQNVVVSLNSVASNLAVGTYTATIWFTNLGDHAVQSRQYSLAILAPPTITSQPAGQPVLDGQTATFSVQAAGGQPLAYQWLFNGTKLVDGGNLLGSTSNVLTIANASSPNVGSYRVIVSNVAAVVASSNALLSITPSAPVITAQPANFTVVVGFSARFSVAAVGDKPFSYQWSFNQTNIPGATNPVLLLTDVQFSQAGGYSVIVSNAIGATKSSSATLAVLPAPPCSTPDPSLVSWWKGETNAFDNAGGNNDGTLVGGATYGAGKVGQGFVFNGSGQGVLVGSGTNMALQTFSLEGWIQRGSTSIVSHGSGGNGVIFGWGQGGYIFYMNAQGNLIFSLLGNPSFVSGPAITDTNFHHVAVTMSSGNVLFYLDGVASSPQAYSISFTFTTEAGIGYRPDNSDNSFLGTIDEISLYSGVLSAGQIQSIYNAQYVGKCDVSRPPVITSQPASQTVAAGQNASFSVAATGRQPLSYQWIFNQTNDVPGATNATLLLGDVQTNQAGYYSVLVANADGSALSSSALLTVTAAPGCIPADPSLVSWWDGQSTTLDAVGTNNGTLVNGATYGPGEVGQGFVFNGSGQGVLVGNNTNMALQDLTIEGWIQRGSTSTVSHGSGGNGVIFGWGQGGYILFLDPNGVLTFSELGVYGQVTGPAITDTGFHHVAVTTSGGTVVFYLDGVASSPQIYNTSFTFTTAVGIGYRADNGDNSFLGIIDEISLYNGALSPESIQAIYYAGNTGKCALPPSFYQQPLSQSDIVGTNVTLTAAATGTPVISYQWTFNGTNLSGATNSSLTLLNVQRSNSGTYSVLAMNSAGSATSSNAVLNVIFAPPTIAVQPTNETVYAGSTAVFSVVANGSAPLGYQWTFNGANLPSGTNSMLTLTNVALNQAGEYQVTVTNSAGSTRSSPAFLSVVSPSLCTKPVSGFVSWWKGENSAFDVIGTNNGTLVGAATYGPGNVGQAFVFNGQGQGVQLGNSASLALQNFTIESWIKRGSTSTVSYGSGGVGCLFGWGSGGYLVYMGSSGNLVLSLLGNPNYVSGPTITDTNFHHIAVTKSNAIVTFFLDGVAHNTSTYSVTFGFTSSVGIGYRPDNGDNGFLGTIDEMSVYNRALSASEVSSIYNAGSDGKCAPLPVITMEPSNMVSSVGCSATFSVAATGATQLNYQWWKDGSALNGQTSSVLTLNNIQPTNFGTYWVIVSSPYGAAVSSVNAQLALDHAPVPGADNLQRFAAGGVRVPLSLLLSNDIDADGDPLSIIAVSTNSTAGGMVSLQGNWVYYTPPAGNPNSDSYTYILSDGHCGGTSTGLVNVTIKPDDSPTGTFGIQSQANGSALLSFAGFPGRTYRLQCTSDLNAPLWHDLSTNTADNFGTFQFTDPTATNAPTRYYRAVSP